jgi:hypothetical protein
MPLAGPQLKEFLLEKTNIPAPPQKVQVMRSACLETHQMWCGEFSVRVVIAVVVEVQAAEECRLLLIMRIAPLKSKAMP